MGYFHTPTSLALLLLASVLGMSSPSAVATIPASDTMGPGTGTILIHEYPNVTSEMRAFEAGLLDLTDFPVPDEFFNVWTGNPANPRSIVSQGRAILAEHSDLSMFQIDINNHKWPTNDVALRRALAYLVDRQRIILDFAGGRATPICSGTAAAQAGSVSCEGLGYPTTYGDFDPKKALQVLYEGGWRDQNQNGILEAPNGTEPSLIFIIRSDDSVRRQAGLMLANQLQNLPRAFRDEQGLDVVVCPSAAICRINLDSRVLDRFSANAIIRAQPIDDWHLYTGAWFLDTEPTHLFFLYSTESAFIACGGAWGDAFPDNYLCFSDTTFDRIVRDMIAAPNYDDLIAAARAAQERAWGYDQRTGRVIGVLPTIPLYSLLGVKGAWLYDQGDSPIVNPDGTVACWTGFIGEETGEGLDNPATLSGAHLYNCQSGSTYVSYRGQGTLDWGLSSTVQGLNPFTSIFPPFTQEQRILELTYQRLLGRNPANQEIVPVLAESFGESTYLDARLGVKVTIVAFKLGQDVLWSDGTPFTGEDVAFSLEYARATCTGPYCPYTPELFDTEVVGNSDGSQTVLVFMSGGGVFSTLAAGFQLIAPKHVWCASWPDTKSNCAYPLPSLFPDFDLAKHVGTGPYIFAVCEGASCNETITLKANPFYSQGTRFWSIAAGISLQPDLNRDNYVNQADLDLLSRVDPDDVRFDVDYRTASKGVQKITFPSPGEIVVYDINSNDRYDEGETVILGVPPAVGALLRDDTKLKYVDHLAPYGVWNLGEYVILDGNVDGKTDVGDITVAPFGYRWGQADVPLKDDPKVKFIDQNFDGSWNDIEIPTEIDVILKGPVIDATDRYIAQRLVHEGEQQSLPGGIIWPPIRSLTYNWPDVNKDNVVNLDDLIGVYLHQFQDPTGCEGDPVCRAEPVRYNISSLAMNDVDYDMDIDLGDLIITFAREFTRPPGS